MAAPARPLAAPTRRCHHGSHNAHVAPFGARVRSGSKMAQTIFEALEGERLRGRGRRLFRIAPPPAASSQCRAQGVQRPRGGGCGTGTAVGRDRHGREQPREPGPRGVVRNSGGDRARWRAAAWGIGPEHQRQPRPAGCGGTDNGPELEQRGRQGPGHGEAPGPEQPGRDNPSGAGGSLTGTAPAARASAGAGGVFLAGTAGEVRDRPGLKQCS